MQDERTGGVELLALYGEDDEYLGSMFQDRMRTLRNRPKKKKQYIAFRKVPKGIPRVPQIPQLYGENERMGAFLPGLKKAIKKVGKFTSGITTGLARAVGVPQSALNALAHIDPTKKGSAGSQILTTAQQVATSFLPGQNKAVVPVQSSALKANPKNMLIIAGAGVGVLALIGVVVATRRKRA
jgi:hypothetical protein